MTGLNYILLCLVTVARSPRRSLERESPNILVSVLFAAKLHQQSDTALETWLINQSNNEILFGHIIILFSSHLTGCERKTAYAEWTIPLKEAASILWDFYCDLLRSLTLLSLNVLCQKS